MFLLRWIATLLALPFVWLGRLGCMLNMPLGIWLLKAAWFIGGDGDVARTALAAMHAQQGPDAARAQAALWMARQPRPEVAAFAGLTAIQAGDLDLAQGYLWRGREVGDDPSGMLDILEYLLATLSPVPRAAEELALEFEQRRDLPPNLSRMVLAEVMLDALLGGQFDEAHRRAGRLLAVEHLQSAEMVLWALARRQGDAAQADVHLKRGALPEAERLYYQFVGSLAIGNMDEAMGYLAELREVHGGLTAQAEKLLYRRGGSP